MDATLKTICFLRQLTADGLLTGNEVWSLASFLTKNGDCASVWPGNLLAPMLESAFDDSVLNEEEMRLIAETISSVEEEWRLKNPCTQEEIEDAEPISVRQALIPVIDAKFEIPAPDDESYVVMLKEPRCTCPDWKPREPLPAQHPGKCCQHVAHAFTRTGKVFEPWFQALLDDCFAHARGTNPALEWRLLELPDKPALVALGAGAWCNIYAPAQEGYETYAFNRLQKLWSYGTAPRRAAQIERAIRENFADL